VRALNLVVRFLLELCALAALAVSGWQAPGPWAVRLVLVVLLPVLAAAAWGRWVAPKAGHRLADPGRLGVELVVIGAAAVGLVLTGYPWWAVALAATYAVNVALVFGLHQRDH